VAPHPHSWKWSSHVPLHFARRFIHISCDFNTSLWSPCLLAVSDIHSFCDSIQAYYCGRPAFWLTLTGWFSQVLLTKLSFEHSFETLQIVRVRMCVARLPDCEKALPHVSQRCGGSPVCVRMCVARCQTADSTGRSLRWRRRNSSSPRKARCVTMIWRPRQKGANQGSSKHQVRYYATRISQGAIVANVERPPPGVTAAFSARLGSL